MRSKILRRLPIFIIALALVSCETKVTPPPAEPTPPPAPPAVPPPPPATPPPPPAPGALSLAVVSGDQQTGTVGVQLPQPLVVKVTRTGAGPESAQALTFRVTAGGGNVSAATATTDADGIVRATWTLGTRSADPQKLEVQAVDHVTGTQVPAVVLSATAVAAAPASMTVSAGQEPHGDAGDPVDVNPAVQLKDRFGNPASGVSVKFAVTSGNGSVTGGDAVTNSSGVATVGSWIIGTQGGTHTLTATAAGSGISGNPQSFKYSFCDCWSSVAAMPTGRAGLAATEFNGKLFTVGGYNPWYSGQIESYDPPIRVWGFENYLGLFDYGLGVAAARGLLFIVGGAVYNGTTNALQVYDPATTRMSYRAEMPTARHTLGVANLDGIIYAVGGIFTDQTGGPALATVEAYDPSNNTWTTKSSMPTPRYGLGVAVVDGILYAIGGYRDASPLTTVEAYDPKTDRWTTKASMPTPRYVFGIGVVNGQIYVVGGSDGNNTVSTVVSYDPKHNRWKNRAPLPTARRELAAATVDGSLYATGGSNSGQFLSTVEVYKP